MSIRKKQVLQLTNNIIERELKRGIYPRTTDVLRQIQRRIRTRSIGIPTMQSRFIDKGSSVDTSSHNQMLDEIYQDLDLLYSEAIDQAKQIDTNFTHYDAASKQLSYEVNKQTTELKNLMLVADNTNHYIHVISDYFHDLSHVDVVNTSAHVQDGYVSNATRFAITTADLTDSDITFSVNNIDGIVNHYMVPGSSIEHMINNQIDSAWQHNIETSRQGTYGGTIGIAPRSPITTNRIVIRTHTSTPMNMTIRYSPDYGINWFTLGSSKVDTLYSLDFSELTITDLSIYMTKDTPDTKHDTDGTHIYNFGISQIAIYTSGYTDRSIFRSIDYNISDLDQADSVVLWVDDMVPSGNNIVYQVKINDNWTYISPINYDTPRHSTVIPFGALYTPTPIKIEMPSDLPPAEYEVVRLHVNQQRFYKLGSLPHNIIKDSIQLYKGMDMWSIKTYDDNLVSSRSNLTEVLDKLSPTDTIYTPILSDRPGLLPGITAGDNKTRRHSIILISDVAQTIPNTNPIADVPISIYLNQELVYHGRPQPADHITYQLRQGSNYLDVLVYAPEGTSVSTDIALDLLRYRGNIYGQQQAMEQVSLFELRNMNPATNYDKYALADIDDELSIILNHAPLGIPFGIKYSYKETSIDRIAVRAILTKDPNQSDTTARILGYELRFA